MPEGVTLRLEGYQGFMRATARAEEETEQFTRETFQRVGERIRHDAQSSMSPIHAKTAAGFRSVVRQSEVIVEQSLGKTTGAHPEWGAWQMRHALVPAAEANEDNLLRELDGDMSRVADHFNRGP